MLFLVDLLNACFRLTYFPLKREKVMLPKSAWGSREDNLRPRITAGVPQSSVVGPLMVSVFVNDGFGVWLSLFADDTTAFTADVNPTSGSSQAPA